jgi:glutathione S-transferase
MEEVLVNIGRGETKTPAYRAVNKLGKVPCLQVRRLLLLFSSSSAAPATAPPDPAIPFISCLPPLLQEPDGYTVCESATIFRYLCNTRSTSVPDHWYPAAPRARAPVDAALDWSLGTLRPTTALTVFNRVIAPLRGTAGNSVLVEQHSLPAMKTALEALEGQFLADGKYVAGEDISLADLQIACELEQLCLLDGAKEVGCLLLVPCMRLPFRYFAVPLVIQIVALHFCAGANVGGAAQRVPKDSAVVATGCRSLRAALRRGARHAAKNEAESTAPERAAAGQTLRWEHALG